MAAESKTGCFLNFPKKSLSGPALPPPPPRGAFWFTQDANRDV